MMYVHSAVLYIRGESVCSSMQVRLGKLLGNTGTWEGKLKVESVGLGTVTSDRWAELTVSVR